MVWRQRQEEEIDLRPVLQWVERQHRPPWEEVAILSLVTKVLWAKFGALRLCDGVLQRAWKKWRRCSSQSTGLWALDTLGQGNRYVLTAMDYFTKWPEPYALPDQEAETIVDALVGGMFSRFGAAESIHSVQGRNFESCVFATMRDWLGIHKTRTTPSQTAW
ncbi:hypothetical protein SKAU_G00411320 [Synaphobranchus kaupii]|uniref:Integrase catalytic domain-containing protein n=1 Tax=Synaphobranchus kaupii TaxID=118154 RepID=A0A9Q1E7T6_SYNKA|nr:hypothetical protein SKAU_G00411320 [Synaphobranchus kaupii]